MPWINPYVKRDGTEVSGHQRSAPGSKRQTTIAGIVVLIVWALGGGHVTIATGDGNAPRPRQDAVVYPIVHPAPGGQR